MALFVRHIFQFLSSKKRKITANKHIYLIALEMSFTWVTPMQYMKIYFMKACPVILTRFVWIIFVQALTPSCCLSFVFRKPRRSIKMNLARQFSPAVSQECDRRRTCQHRSDGKALKHDRNFAKKDASLHEHKQLVKTHWMCHKLVGTSAMTPNCTQIMGKRRFS